MIAQQVNIYLGHLSSTQEMFIELLWSIFDTFGYLHGKYNDSIYYF